jgi:S-adenosylmethionine synthetase
MRGIPDPIKLEGGLRRGEVSRLRAKRVRSGRNRRVDTSAVRSRSVAICRGGTYLWCVMHLNTELAPLDPTRRTLEVVERKGVGHPDTLCDAAAEAFSVGLSRHYHAQTGSVLHHNVDKALLLGGRTRVGFGGGEWLDPIVLTLAGRAATRIGEARVPLEEIALAASRQAFRAVRNLEPARVETRVAVRPGEAELREITERGAEEPRANDTSIGVGFAPYSPLERLALDVDARIQDRARTTPDCAFGEDVKVMAVREGEALRLTVACALLAPSLGDAAAYHRAVEELRDTALSAAREAGFSGVEVDVNAADAPSGSYYLTLSGTSAECGDDGQVGRGNRTSGLITPMRPMTLEAYAGKNPRSHVGKLLSVAAQAVAEGLAALEGVRAAECVLVSQIGGRLSEPRGAGVRIDADGISVEELRGSIERIVEAELSRVPELWREIVGIAAG